MPLRKSGLRPVRRPALATLRRCRRRVRPNWRRRRRSRRPFVGRRRRNSKPVVAAAAPADTRSFIQKLFGSAPSGASTLAYAEPESNLLRESRPADSTVTRETRAPVTGPSAHYDQYTAVYDISAHTVYLPDGTRLEAHSGLGDRLDDVRFANERMRGPTPPNLYELTPREQSFHGVQALRLKPIGGGDLFGRAGLLAHSYMLGPNGDSFGCVSFKDYDAFLKAYERARQAPRRCRAPRLKATVVSLIQPC